MRVTNTMLTNNSMINMAKNKEAFMKAMEQYTTEKKIQRPSDDPIIAVRSLKYRANLAELTQYVEKNIPDARSWMEATDDAMLLISESLTKMNTLCNQGDSGPLAVSDRNDIVAELSQCKEFIYEQQINADNAGRYLFSGYRTDTPMLFDEISSDICYSITEKHTFTDIDKFSYVYGGTEYDAGNNTEAYYAGKGPDLLNGHKMMLGYSNLDATDSSGGDYVTITYGGVSYPVKTMPATAAAGSPYNDAYKAGADDIIFIPETGELIFGNNRYDELRKAGSFEVEYNKTEFSKNDLRPEHYYNCTTKNLKTNETKIYSDPEKQQIKYEINFSQSLTVNTLAGSVIGPEVGRKIDEIVNTIHSLERSEAKKADINRLIENADPDNAGEVAALNKLLEQVNLEISLKEQVLTNVLASGLTTTKNAQQKVTVAMADNGARLNRLEMTFNKLEDQKVRFEDILSKNEDIDLGDAFIKYNQADMLYQTSLSATSKLLGNSLLNFI